MGEVSDNHTCNVCLEQESEVFCYCSGTVVFLCRLDYEQHCQKDKRRDHFPLPMSALSDVRNAGYFLRLQSRTAAVGEGKLELFANLSLIADCIQSLSDLSAQFTALILANIATLETMRSTLETDIADAIAEEEKTHYEECPNVRNQIATALRSYSQGQLVLFSYRISREKLSEMVESLVEFRRIDPWNADSDSEIQIGTPKSGTYSEDAAKVAEIRDESPPEIAQYAKPIAVLPTKVLVFDMETTRWKSLMNLNQRIEVDNFSAATYILPEILFVCGAPNPSQTPCYFLTSSFAHRQPDLLIPRHSPGLLYHPDSSTLFVFGGTHNHTHIKQSEKMDIQKVVWERIADMVESRSMFNPCLHGRLVYICGGYSPSIETYDPALNRFTLLRTAVLPGDFSESGSAAVAYRDSIIVISKRFVSKLSVHSGQIYETLSHKDYEPWSRCTPVLKDESVFLVDLWGKVATIIAVASGTKTRQVPIPTFS